ncbi:MAG: superoxide dismutase [Armatimonadetes bacterium]|nr:superoxide dismutase [Armatimonadota bacterium]
MAMPERILKLEGISETTVREHWKLYEGYVKKANEILTKLQTADRSKANQTYSDLRELKVEYTFALGGARNHEIYFAHLGGKGGPATGRAVSLIRRDFGSFENWAADLKATGIAARGWVWLAYDHNTKRLFNYIGDAQNTYPVWDASPILALDTYEHAYWLDYQTRRGDYIDAFFKNLDWKVVNDRLARAMRR